MRLLFVCLCLVVAAVDARTSCPTWKITGQSAIGKPVHDMKQCRQDLGAAGACFATYIFDEQHHVYEGGCMDGVSSFPVYKRMEDNGKECADDAWLREQFPKTFADWSSTSKFEFCICTTNRCMPKTPALQLSLSGSQP